MLHVNGKPSLLVGLCVSKTMELYWIPIHKGSLLEDSGWHLEETIPFLKGRRDALIALPRLLLLDPMGRSNESAVLRCRWFLPL